MSRKVLIVEDQFIEADYLGSLLKKSGYKVSGIARSVAIARDMIAKERPDLVILDIFLSGKLTGIDLAKELKEAYIAFIYLSANSNEDVLAAAKVTQPCGFLVKPFREKELLIALEISTYRHEHGLEAIFRNEELLRRQFTAIMTRSVSADQKLRDFVAAIQPVISFDFLMIDGGTNTQTDKFFPGFLRVGFDEYQQIGLHELATISKKNKDDIVACFVDSTKEYSAAFFCGDDFENLADQSVSTQFLADTFHLRSMLRLPLQMSNNHTGTLCLYSKQPAVYSARNISFYSRLQQLFNSCIENITRKDIRISNVNEHVPDSRPTLLTRHHEGFTGIIGKNHRLLHVIDQITQVAATDTSVFILGESGTGKEGIATCIYHLSNRKLESFIKVNCGALPPGLVESELFGHEKGSFTGATERKIGKFEMANKGTIFLDEVAEMPPEIQVKLLRVLQEKEIERIGGRDTIKVDIRVIAATNRNLEKEIAEGRFRLDLYYRLFVFPIELPPLRERLDDLPALAYHFMNIYNQKTGKKISGFSDSVLQSMMEYEWPGNIRELEHLIERSVLLAKGNTIDDISLPFKSSKDITGLAAADKVKTIHENERDYIISVLKKCNGRIWGTAGAAELLNIPPSTLKSKMNKLGIKKGFTI